MTRSPVLLIESLDGAGASAEDALLRVAALRAAGFGSSRAGNSRAGARAARPLVIGPAPQLDRFGRPSGSLLPAIEAGVAVIPRHEAAAAVRQALAAQAPELVIVASASPGAEEFHRWLPPATSARWWPTALLAPPPPRRLPWLVARGLEPLGTELHDRSAGAGAPIEAALEWGVVDGASAARRRYPLWDGDYLLVPAPLGGGVGEALIGAFAAVARERDSLDLIVLADPQPVFERQARALGVATRVHFVGAATREAEWAWLAEAAAALFAGPGPITAGLVLRALACGCPVVASGPGGAGPGLDAWLAARGLSVAGDSIVAALVRTLERTPEIVQAIDRGRQLAAGHHTAGVAARLAAALEAHRAAIARRHAA